MRAATWMIDCSVLAEPGAVEKFREVDRLFAPAIELANLRAATEPVGEHDVVRRRLANFREQNLFGACLRDVEMSGFEPEIAGEPATARIETLNRGSGRGEQLGVFVPAENGMLVTVHLREPVHAT